MFLRYRFLQFIFAYLFLAGGFLAYAILIFLYPLRWIYLENLHQRMAKLLCHCHWSILTMVAQWWSDIEVNIYSHPDVINTLGKEKAVVVMNHKFHLDWLALWITAQHFGNLSDFKCLAKKEILWIPIIGQALWLSGSVFLKRDAKTDKDELEKYFANLSAVPFNYWLVLFSEGTRITPSKHKTSVEFALKRGLKPLQQHLMPRTKGFSLVRKGLDKQVTALYDVTAMCPNNENPPLSTFVCGRRAKLDILIRRIMLEKIPYEEDGSARFLEELYYYKDEVCDFYMKNQRFPFNERDELKDFIKLKVPRPLSSLLIVIGWALLLLPPLLTILISYITEVSIYSFSFRCLRDIFCLPEACPLVMGNSHNRDDMQNFEVFRDGFEAF